MTNYLIDTHPLIWKESSCQRKKLSRKVIKIFDRVDEGKDSIFVPAPVVWELGACHRAGKFQTKNHPLFRYWASSRLFAHPNVNFVATQLEDILLATELKMNNDPFDHLIVATARRLNFKLITKDQMIIDSENCQTIW